LVLGVLTGLGVIFVCDFYPQRIKRLALPSRISFVRRGRYRVAGVAVLPRNWSAATTVADDIAAGYCDARARAGSYGWEHHRGRGEYGGRRVRVDPQTC